MILTIGYPCAPPGSEPMGNGALLAKRRQAGVMCKHQVEHKFIHVTATLRCPHTFLRRTAWSAATAVRPPSGPSGALSGPTSGTYEREQIQSKGDMVLDVVHVVWKRSMHSYISTFSLHIAHLYVAFALFEALH